MYNSSRPRAQNRPNLIYLYTRETDPTLVVETTRNTNKTKMTYLANVQEIDRSEDQA